MINFHMLLQRGRFVKGLDTLVTLVGRGLVGGLRPVGVDSGQVSGEVTASLEHFGTVRAGIPFF